MFPTHIIFIPKGETIMNMELVKAKVLEGIKLTEDIIEIMKSFNVRSVYPELQKLRVNAFYNQISEESTLVVEEYYGLPSKVYTPLGYITICAGYTFIDTDGTWKTQCEIESEIHQVMEDKLNLKLYANAKQTNMGIIGGWYTVGKSTDPFINFKKQFEYEEANKLFALYLNEYINKNEF